MNNTGNLGGELSYADATHLVTAMQLWRAEGGAGSSSASAGDDDDESVRFEEFHLFAADPNYADAIKAFRQYVPAPPAPAARPRATH